jgi:adenosylcobinamide-phosphate synthase
VVTRSTTASGRLGAVAIGLAVDRVLGEPPRALHPVARFGQAMAAMEARWWRDARPRGALHAGTGVAVAIGVGGLAERALGPASALVAATATCAAGRELTTVARSIGEQLTLGDIEGARAILPALVGRDVERLSDKEMARAVVESVAENLSDAVVATAWWGAVAGARGALVHRALNTLDAMVGHRTARYRSFGWAAARLDDLFGWPAARATALLVAMARPRQARAVWSAVRLDAPRHPSPNAGVAEAAFAGALGLRLGGTNHYAGSEEVRPPLGTGRPPEPGDIARAVELADDVVTLLLVLCAAGALIGQRHHRPAVGQRHHRPAVGQRHHRPAFGQRHHRPAVG